MFDGVGPAAVDAKGDELRGLQSLRSYVFVTLSQPIAFRPVVKAGGALILPKAVCRYLIKHLRASVGLTSVPPTHVWLLK